LELPQQKGSPLESVMAVTEEGEVGRRGACDLLLHVKCSGKP